MTPERTPRCEWCGAPTWDRHLIRLDAGITAVVDGRCKAFLEQNPKRAGIPRSDRREALDDWEYGEVRSQLQAPHPPGDADPFAGLG